MYTLAAVTSPDLNSVQRNSRVRVCARLPQRFHKLGQQTSELRWDPAVAGRPAVGQTPVSSGPVDAISGMLLPACGPWGTPHF